MENDLMEMNLNTIGLFRQEPKRIIRLRQEPKPNGGFATYSGLDAVGAWNDYYRQADNIVADWNHGNAYIPTTLIIQIHTGLFIPWCGNYEDGFYCK